MLELGIFVRIHLLLAVLASIVLLGRVYANRVQLDGTARTAYLVSNVLQVVIALREGAFPSIVNMEPIKINLDKILVCLYRWVSMPTLTLLLLMQVVLRFQKLVSELPL